VDEAQRLLDAMTPAQRMGRHAYIQVAEASAWVLANSGDIDGAVDVIDEAVRRGAERGAVFLAALAACVPIRLGHAERAAELLELLMSSAPAELEIVACLRDLAIAPPDGDGGGRPSILRRVEASGQAPTVLDAIAQALTMRPSAELRRKLELIAVRIAPTIDERAFLRRQQPLLSRRELEVARAAASRERSKEIA